MARVHGGAAEPTVPSHQTGGGQEYGVEAVVCSAMCRRSWPESGGDSGSVKGGQVAGKGEEAREHR
jgi:hypothetical protein